MQQSQAAKIIQNESTISVIFPECIEEVVRKRRLHEKHYEVAKNFFKYTCFPNFSSIINDNDLPTYPDQTLTRNMLTQNSRDEYF